MSTGSAITTSWYQNDEPVARGGRKDEFVRPVGVNRTDHGMGWAVNMVNSISQPYHSDLERDFIWWASLIPTCISIWAQPTTIVYETPDGPRNYTPDFLVECSDRRPFYVEVKPSEYLEEEDTAHRLSLVEPVINKAGADFLRISERTLKREPRYDNICLLQHYRSFKPPIEIVRLIELEFTKRHQIPISELRTVDQDGLLVRDSIRSLILRRWLVTDLDKPLNDSSVIRHNSRPQPKIIERQFA